MKLNQESVIIHWSMRRQILRSVTKRTMRGIDYMSASDKKRLRKEQNAAAMTEKQLQQKKEAKKLKAYTVTFVVVMVLVVAILAGVALRTPINSLIDRNTVAVTVGDHKINATEFNYFYIDSATSFYSNYYNSYYSSYGNYTDLLIQMTTGLSGSTALDDQIADSEKNTTWADYFIDYAKESIKWTYAMYDLAQKEGFALPDSSKTGLETTKKSLDYYASQSGYSSTDNYLRSIYGSGASEESYLAYSEICSLAEAYAEQYYDSITFTNADYREYEKDKYDDYASFSYARYNLTVSDYLKYLYPAEESTDSSDSTSSTSSTSSAKTEYTDEQRAAALAAAKADAEKLANASNTTVELLNLAISHLERLNGVDADDIDTATEVSEAMYSSISSDDIKKWLTEKDREVGDIGVLETKTTDADNKETVTGYYVILFTGRDDNLVHLANVRHILIKFEGGTTDKTTGKTTYSEAEKNAAKEECEILLKDFLANNPSDEAFAEMANKNSDDSPEGGLYENVTPGDSYVENWLNWCFEGHEPGDTGIIETEYGYHIMYYKGDADMTYRDYLINADMVDEAYAAWVKEQTAAVTLTENNLSRVNRDFVING